MLLLQVPVTIIMGKKQSQKGLKNKMFGFMLRKGGWLLR